MCEKNKVKYTKYCKLLIKHLIIAEEIEKKMETDPRSTYVFSIETNKAGQVF